MINKKRSGLDPPNGRRSIVLRDLDGGLVDLSGHDPFGSGLSKDSEYELVGTLRRRSGYGLFEGAVSGVIVVLEVEIGHGGLVAETVCTSGRRGLAPAPDTVVLDHGGRGGFGRDLHRDGGTVLDGRWRRNAGNLRDSG